MLLEIVQYGNPVLREKCIPVTHVDDSIRQLAVNMLETMVAAEGVGLAAPQIGLPIQMAVIDVGTDSKNSPLLLVDGVPAQLEDIMPLVFINPQLELLKPNESATEGCLSIPNIHAQVNRPSIVRANVELLDGTRKTIECSGLLARAFQHECDHLNGVLFVDRISSSAKITIHRKLKRLLGR